MSKIFALSLELLNTAEYSGIYILECVEKSFLFEEKDIWYVRDIIWMQLYLDIKYIYKICNV